MLHLEAIAEDGVVEVVVLERFKGLLVANGKGAGGSVVGEGHRLVDALHLCEFGCPGAVGRDDTIVEEVALVGTGIVVAAHVLVEAVDLGLTAEDGLRVDDGLVHPVPDAAADTEVAIFDDVPVFLEVAKAVAHGVSIFAHEEGLVTLVAGGFSLHIGQRGIHDGVDVRPLRAARVSRAFVVDGAWIEGAHSVVGSRKVAAYAALVAQGPEDDGGVVAVAQHGADAAVHKLAFP